ncbi:MAG: polysaccharide deacetylase family protein [Halobacteriota archaeon]
MDDVSELRRREVKTYFDVIARGGSERLLSARSFHNLGEWDHEDYCRLSDTLLDANATSSFSFLGRDAERYAETIRMLDDAGHEIVLHGHRHVACDDVDYELAHENLSRGLNAIEDAAGVTPGGFIAPRQEVNAATLQVVAELGMEWVLGRTDADVPAGIDFLEPAHPYDLIFLNEGADPAEAFDRIRDQTRPGAALLFHPNMLEYYDALDQFDAWIADTTPVSITSLFETGGVGLINDAMRPLRIV